jgi:hypothetical protein
MVFLAVTRSGYEAYRALGRSADALWVGAGVLSDKELASLRRSGVDVSDFNYEIELHESEVIAGAVDTIKEHHPGEVLWIQS